MIHIMLVSHQAAANLLPALDPDNRPDRAILLASDKMQAGANALQLALQTEGIRSEVRQIDNVHDYGRMQDYFLELATELDGEKVGINLTGGTKLMVLAAHAVAQMQEWNAFYLDIDTNELTHLIPRESGRVPLQADIPLSRYLQAYGFDAPRPEHQLEVRPNHVRVLDALINRASDDPKAIGSLNRLAQDADRSSSLSATLSDQDLVNADLHDILDILERDGLIHWNQERGRVQFRSEFDRRYAGGLWLEKHVLRTVESLKKDLGLRDVRWSQEVIRHSVGGSQGSNNELDVVFMHRNRLFVIECKTRRMDGDNDAADNAIYKLEQIHHHVGGLAAKGMLVSFRKVREADRRRARELRLELVDAEGLRSLADRIRRWVEQ